ncbi:hypothetical protein ILYODFUR_014382 [Ilyodon furcidens]|uniref:Uncharacterized protein n=1 Tax=Ilyodon furcidens TaxID=33524 RepID=A0ABV0U6N9_9TELE
MSRKKRESKKLIFKARSKPNKNCIKDVAKNKKKKTMIEKESEDIKIADDKEKAEKEEDKTVSESTNAAQVEAAGEFKKDRKIRCEEDKEVDAGMVISVKKVIKKDGLDKSEDKGEENCTAEREKKDPDVEGSKKIAESLGKEEVEKVAETVVTVETQSETKEKELEGTSKVECVIENGIETDEKRDYTGENTIKTEEPVEVVANETVADPTTTHPNPEEAQE